MKRKIPVSFIVMGVLLLLLAGGAVVVRWHGSSTSPALSGVVVDGSGKPVSGAVVSSGGRRVRVGADGGFSIPVGGGDAAELVRARARGWVTRTRAVAAGESAVIRLVRRAPGTVTFTFGGDVMFGRRFYDPDEDGTAEGLLRPGAGVAEHARLLRDVVPLLDTADVTAVNLETPLVRDPWYSPIGPRPPRFHPTKDFAFASAPSAAVALRGAGVDVVDLGNNHLYDALEAGVRSTLANAAAAGFTPGASSFGAGVNAPAAWKPAVHVVGGHRVAFVGCTSILGTDQAITYVAGPHKGGAAPCSAGPLRAVVHAARKLAPLVVVMIHGGYEYGRDPSAQITRLTNVAHAAGATLVINHHPHVTGGVDVTPGGPTTPAGGLTAWTLGNLLFDQTVWPTFDSYLLNVVVTSGRVTGAWLEPLRIQGFRPVPITGADAEWVTRGAAVRSRGPWVQDDGSLWLDVSGAARSATTTTTAPLSKVVRGCAAGAGRDLLWTGDFERRDLRQDEPAPLWDVEANNPYRKVTPVAAHHGRYGVLMGRASPNSSDVVLTPQHRQLVRAGDKLTVLLDTRRQHGRPGVVLQLAWYNDTKGGSQQNTTVRIPDRSDWRTWQIDVAVPPNAVAVQPYVRLAVPSRGVSQVAVDDVRLVDWNQPGCDFVHAGSIVQGRSVSPLPAKPRTVDLTPSPLSVTAPSPLPPGTPQTDD